MSKVYVKPKFAIAIDKAVNQNKSISDKPGKLDSSIKVLKKIGKAHNHSLPLGFQWLWLKHNVDLLTPYQVKYFNRKKGTSAWKRKGSGDMADIKENNINEMKSLKQLLSKVKSGKMDKKTAKDLEKLVTRGDGFVVITKSKKNGYNRFHANFVGERGIDVVPHMRDFRPKKGVYKPEHAMTDINWKDVKDMYIENKINERTQQVIETIKGNLCIECGNPVNEDLKNWFKKKWVNIGKKVGGKHPPCGTSGKKKGYAKCVPASKAASMSKKEKESATRRKRAAQNKAGRGGRGKTGAGSQGKKPINVSTHTGGRKSGTGKGS